MATVYRDRWISCAEDGIRIRGYYFPWGTKHVRYDRLRSLKRVEMGPLTGRYRIWGTALPRYWASLDPGRIRKKTALVLDVGRYVHPVITPDQPDEAEAVIRAHLRPTA